MHDQRKRSHDEALYAFVPGRVEIDALLLRLTNLSTDDFGLDPAKVDCGQVGTLRHHARQLREISDSASLEGEHAA